MPWMTSGSDVEPRPDGRRGDSPMPVEVDDEAIRALIDAARDASRKAYCPYSRFPVGAAVLGEEGAIVSGSI